MKYAKFRDQLEQNPWLVETIGFGHLVEHPNLKNSEVNEIIRTFVRQKLEFVAFRPFEKLDLNSERQDGRNTLEYAVRCETYFGGDPNTWYEEKWEIVWHMGDQTEHRGDPVQWISLQAKIDEIKAWFVRQCASGDERPLHFDRVIKVATSGRIPKGEVSEMSVEVYPFPNGSVLFPPVPAGSGNHGDLARRYALDEPMPPLFPGTLGFVT